MTARRLIRREFGLRTREALTGYGFVLIWVVGFALFTFIPLVETIRYSVNYTPAGGWPATSSVVRVSDWIYSAQAANT